MALYNNSAFGPGYKYNLRMGTQTQPNYLFGSYNFDTQPFRYQVTAVSGDGTNATVNVTLIAGGGPSPLIQPSVGAVMGVHGTFTDAPVYNVDPTTVTAVSINTQTNTGTISYPCSDVHAMTPDSGELVVQPYEFPDLVAAGTASQPIALIFTPDESDNSRCLFAEAKWYGTLPTAATVVLQVANVDRDDRYQTIQNTYGTSPTAVVPSSDSLATIAGSAVTQSGAEYSFIMGKFIRAKVLSMTGGDSTTGLVVTVFA